MKTQKEIEKGLKEMETRKSSYLLDMASYKAPNSCVYDTELIRKLEVTDATIHALKWVLYTEKKPSGGKKKVKNLRIADVSQQRELLVAFVEHCNKPLSVDDMFTLAWVDDFLSNQ